MPQSSTVQVEASMVPGVRNAENAWVSARVRSINGLRSGIQKTVEELTAVKVEEQVKVRNLEGNSIVVCYECLDSMGELPELLTKPWSAGFMESGCLEMGSLSQLLETWITSYSASLNYLTRFPSVGLPLNSHASFPSFFFPWNWQLNFLKECCSEASPAMAPAPD